MIKRKTERFFANSGSPIRTTYELKISTKTGALELFEKGKEDFQSYIESFRESCDLECIIRRIKAGELDLLTAAVGSYGDFTGVPSTMQEALQIGLDAKNTWSGLTADQKDAFGSYDEFLEKAGSAEWLEKFGIKLNETDVKEDAVNADDEQ